MSWLFAGDPDPDDAAILHAMRGNETLDALGIAILSQAYAGPQRHRACIADNDHRLDRVLCLFGGNLDSSQRRRLKRDLVQALDPLTPLTKAGAFTDWPLVKAALSKMQTTDRRIH